MNKRDIILREVLALREQTDRFTESFDRMRDEVRAYRLRGRQQDSTDIARDLRISAIEADIAAIKRHLGMTD